MGSEITTAEITALQVEVKKDGLSFKEASSLSGDAKSALQKLIQKHTDTDSITEESFKKLAGDDLILNETELNEKNKPETEQTVTKGRGIQQKNIAEGTLNLRTDDKATDKRVKDKDTIVALENDLILIAKSFGIQMPENYKSDGAWSKEDEALANSIRQKYGIGADGNLSEGAWLQGAWGPRSERLRYLLLDKISKSEVSAEITAEAKNQATEGIKKENGFVVLELEVWKQKVKTWGVSDTKEDATVEETKKEINKKNENLKSLVAVSHKQSSIQPQSPSNTKLQPSITTQVNKPVVSNDSLEGLTNEAYKRMTTGESLGGLSWTSSYNFTFEDRSYSAQIGRRGSYVWITNDQGEERRFTIMNNSTVIQAGGSEVEEREKRLVVQAYNAFISQRQIQTLSSNANFERFGEN